MNYLLDISKPLRLWTRKQYFWKPNFFLKFPPKIKFTLGNLNMIYFWRFLKILEFRNFVCLMWGFSDSLGWGPIVFSSKYNFSQGWICICNPILNSKNMKVCNCNRANSSSNLCWSASVLQRRAKGVLSEVSRCSLEDPLKTLIRVTWEPSKPLRPAAPVFFYFACSPETFVDFFKCAWGFGLEK